MKNNRYYLIIAFFFVAAAAAFYLNIQTEKKLKEVERKAKSSDPVKVEVTDTPGKTTTIKGNSIDLIRRGEPIRCTYSEEIAKDVLYSGTIYTDGTSSRSNVRTKTIEKETQTNTIFTSDYIYMWSTGDLQGIKMSALGYDISNTNRETTPSQGVVPGDLAKLEQEYEFECTKWIVDKGMFAVPTTFAFVDISDALAKIKENPCLVCDTMDASRQAQCKKSLKCK